MMNKSLLLGLSVFLTACSTLLPPLNHPAPKETIKINQAPLSERGRSDDLALILTFSGGGTRAAAFSYGVMQALREIQIGKKGDKSLLEEVDLISSVSGGSFTAAYYGLYGDKLFSRYEKDFLKRPVQSSLLKFWLLTPTNWIRLAPALYNRSDLAADYYSNTIFGRKTFADMRRDGPQIFINATDLGTGSGFSFTRDNFRWICSDLNKFPVGRAVAASSAVPVLFSPIAMKNYGGSCKPYPHQQKELSDSSMRVDAQAYGLRKYMDAERYKYLHLVDGGVVGNLGVRPLLHIIFEQKNNFWQVMKTFNMKKTRKVAFIVVNAADAIPPVIPLRRREPGTAETLSAVTTIQSTRYNEDTLDLLESLFPKWKKQIQEGRCREKSIAHCKDIEFYLAELNFKQLPKDQRDELALLETSLQLPPESIDKLIESGKQLLRQSPEFKRLLSDMKGQTKQR
ncbi:MAG: Patatin [uncultured Thiotrichaceae bacterium]|uniref:Patatin n=1 Tax=uncultured Thiotrichaceae bacterium TaxID=298394 RepID=A0A6S6SEV0_9GAMM|nr:MAG: Patatin [uncultured Thiotrichaceae bacterium]